MMETEKAADAPPLYSAWFGKPVVLVVALRQSHLPLHCSIIGESNTCVRIRIPLAGWEMDVEKKLILAVEGQFGPSNNYVN
jgi:hypothetical protein